LPDAHTKADIKPNPAVASTKPLNIGTFSDEDYEEAMAMNAARSTTVTQPPVEPNTASQVNTVEFKIGNQLYAVDSSHPVVQYIHNGELQLPDSAKVSGLTMTELIASIKEDRGGTELAQDEEDAIKAVFKGE